MNIIATFMSKTRKIRHLPKIHGKIIEKVQGWKKIHIYGDPYQRGFAHGYLLAHELKRVKRSLPFWVKEIIRVPFSEYLKINRQIMFPILQKKFPEYWEEIYGIHLGAKHAGVNISMNYLVGWNATMSMYSFFKDGVTDDNRTIQRCSAFIATGDATIDGKIVMAHNVHSDLLTGQLLNIIMKITPDNGHEFTMQTSAGLISSVSDWYIGSTGIVCCETTIADINYKPEFGVPFFCRIRETIQYAANLEDCSKIMLKENAGDYACSWLFGDINTNEIMLLELGKKIHHKQIAKNGILYGMNSAVGFELRTKETDDTDFNDTSTRCGNRNYRLNELLNHQYYGKINVSVAKRIISDHYDIQLAKNVFNRNGICKHPELDPEMDYRPYSCTDGKVMDAKSAKTQNFYGIFGSSCGKRFFDVKKYIKEHPQYKPWGAVLEDMPVYKWTFL
jgi:hypothetical protein